MTTEELNAKVDKLRLHFEAHEEATGKLLILERQKRGELADVVNSLKDVVVYNAESHDVCVSDIGGKWDAHEERIVNQDAKIAEVNENMDSLQTVVRFADAQSKKVEEMRADVALCKAGIRDLDAIRDTFTQSAKGFSERVAVLEESFAAFQTLRHHDDDPQPVPTTAIEPAASDPAGSPGVDNMA